MKKEQEEGYTGENEKWFQFNKRIVIRREARAGETEGQAYLIRRTLVSFGKYFSIKYHQIMQSDDVCPHDHPWGFLTIILKGGYYEWTPVDQNDKGEILANHAAVDGGVEVKKWHGAGSIMYRPAKWRHRLELKTPVGFYGAVTTNTRTGKITFPSDPIVAHTLVFTFKTIRDWGFFTKTGWIFWKDYNKLRDC